MLLPVYLAAGGVSKSVREEGSSIFRERVAGEIVVYDSYPFFSAMEQVRLYIYDHFY